MKQLNKFFIITAFLLISNYIVGQIIITGQSRNLNDFSIQADFTLPINNKIYLNSWNSYQSFNNQYADLSSYITSINFINYKLTKIQSKRVTVTVGVGNQLYKDYRFGFNYNAWLVKWQIKIF